MRVRAFFPAHCTSYLVMDYYPACTIAEYLERRGGRLPEAEAVQLIRLILEGLRAVHAQGFLHRDIKPQNIYLADTGGAPRPLLIDFGAARQGTGERTRTVICSDGYSPIEQHHEKGRQGPWTDLNATAAVLYRVEQVSWNDIQTFLGRLNAKGGGKPYRLPTEAEWEYAARAGSKTPYWWGKDLGKGNANCEYCGSQWDDKETAPVGSFKPNAFGLQDTAGNVWEWVQDCGRDSYAGVSADGAEWHDNCLAGRGLRGGSWNSIARDSRVSFRNWLAPDDRYGRLGLRLAQDL